MKKVIRFLATGFGSGYIPFAPGTFGSIVGVGVYYLLKDLLLWPYMITLLALIFLSAWISTLAEISFGEKDCQKIVIDEIIGILVTLTLVEFKWKQVLVGFILFRLFDIIKPPPARLCQNRMPTGWGIVGDDVVAGIYANLALQVLLRFGLFTRF